MVQHVVLCMLETIYAYNAAFALESESLRCNHGGNACTRVVFLGHVGRFYGRTSTVAKSSAPEGHGS